MKVYIITFPDGSYYIGSTKRTLLQRMRSHKSETSLPAKEFSPVDLLKMTEVVYHGWDAEFVEKQYIYNHRGDKNMLNSRRYDTIPDRKEWLKNTNSQYILGIYKEIKEARSIRFDEKIDAATVALDTFTNIVQEIAYDNYKGVKVNENI